MPPDAETRHDAGEWLQRAERDFQAARAVLEATPSLPEVAVYHVQQAVEKALKGFLTLHGVPFPLTHDLVDIRMRCERIDPDFAQFADTTLALNPYIMRFRYPGGPLAPPDDEARRAIELAAQVLAFVRSRLES